MDLPTLVLIEQEAGMDIMMIERSNILFAPRTGMLTFSAPLPAS